MAVVRFVPSSWGLCDTMPQSGTRTPPQATVGSLLRRGRLNLACFKGTTKTTHSFIYLNAVPRKPELKVCLCGVWSKVKQNTLWSFQGTRNNSLTEWSVKSVCLIPHQGSRSLDELHKGNRKNDVLFGHSDLKTNNCFYSLQDFKAFCISQVSRNLRLSEASSTRSSFGGHLLTDYSKERN